MKKLIAVTTAIIALFTSAYAKLHVINLGTLDGDIFSGATGINNFGEIIGTSTSSNGLTHSFYYWKGHMSRLGRGTAAANAINDRGQIVGDLLTLTTNIILVYLPILPTNPPFPPTPLNPSVTSFDVKPDSGIVDNSGSEMLFTNIFYRAVPAIFRSGRWINLAGTNSGVADAINNRSEVVGSSIPSGSPITQAVLFRKGLANQIPPANSFVAADINNRGDIVGELDMSAYNTNEVGFPTHAFLYHHGQTQDLGTLGGSDAGAIAINDRGDIAGWSATDSNSGSHAFLYHNGTMLDIGTLDNTNENYPAGFCFPYAINNRDQIVGGSFTGETERAFLYSGGRMIDLNDLVELTHLDGPPGFLLLTMARGINDYGQIVGYGIYWNGTQTYTRAFLLNLNSKTLGENLSR